MPVTATATVLKSAGPLLFAPGSPDGSAILFVANVQTATVHAFEFGAETSDTAPGSAAPDVRIDHLGTSLAALLGVEPADVLIRGLAVHPGTHAVYLSIARGRGPEAGPALVRADLDGSLSVVETDDLPVTSFELDDAPSADDARQDFWLDGTASNSEPREFNGVTLDIAQVPAARSTITGLAWVDGTLFVAGLSNEQFSSRLRQIAYPFDGSATATSVEIYHVDHGKYETESPIRALTAFDGGASILATYTCTPVARFSVSDLRGEGLVRGRTVAELGPMNQPFSIVSYDLDGQEYLLVSNTRHPLLKIPAASIDEQASLSLPLSDPQASQGVPRETLDHPGITWMANLDRSSVVVVQYENGDTHLRTLQAADL